MRGSRLACFATMALLVGACSAVGEDGAELQACGVKTLARTGGRSLPAELRPTFPRRAVDHIVTYASWRGWGPKGGDRVVLTRRGALVRIDTHYIGSKRDFEADHVITHANLATGASINVRLNSDGSLRTVGLWKGNGGASRTRAEPTDRSELIAGERCSVWEGRYASSPVRYSACITRDGVVLRDTVHYASGDVMEEQRALKVERRQVSPAQVLPPREVLDWGYWSDGHAPLDASGDRPANYNLVLTKAGMATRGGRTTYRAQGGWTAVDTCARGEGGSLRLAGSRTNLAYSDRTDGWTTLSLAHRTARPERERPEPDTKPLQDAPATVLGETCTWFDAAVGVSDYNRKECRTRDNLPLLISESSWGGGAADSQAVALSRGKTSPEALVPPRWMMNWGFWGWPQLARTTR